jgi:hypothetical protein
VLSRRLGYTGLGLYLGISIIVSACCALLSGGQTVLLISEFIDIVKLNIIVNDGYFYIIINTFQILHADII